MATLEELVVSLVAETSGLRAELDKATKATVGATDKMDKAIEEFSKNSSTNVGVFQTAMGTAIGFLGSQAVLGAFSALKDAASFLFQELIVNGVASASATETAINKLNQALALSGQYSKTASQEMVDLAGALQATTRYGDDAILSASALIQTIGKLGAGELPQATSAAVDLAAALSIDLDSAAKLVGKAAIGNVDAFKRYGIEIEKGTTASQTFANAMRTLSGFQGTAAAQAKTFAGITDILKYSWEDLTKVTGNAIITNQALLNVLSAVNEMVVGGTKDLEGNSLALKELIANGLITFIDILGVGVTTLDLFVRSVQFLMGALNALLAPLHLVAAGLEYLINGADAAEAQLNEWIETTTKDLGAFGKSGDGVLSNLAEKFATLSVAGQSGLEAIKAGMDATVEPTNNATAAVVALTEAEQMRVDNLKNFAEGLADKGASLEEHYAYEQELLNLALENQTITEEEYHIERMAVLAAQHEEELAMLEQYNQLKGSSDATYQAARSALLQKQDLETKKFGNQMLTYETSTNKLRAQNLKDTLGVMATLSSSGNKTLAAIGKASAISIATIDGFAAVQKALASAPPPFNFALAAAVGAATAINIAKIGGVALNKGGTVPGTGPNRDSVPAMLTPGEEVINRSTANQLRNFLNNQGTGSQKSTVEITLKDDLIDFIEARIVERQTLGLSKIGV